MPKKSAHSDPAGHESDDCRHLGEKIPREHGPTVGAHNARVAR